MKILNNLKGIFTRQTDGKKQMINEEQKEEFVRIEEEYAILLCLKNGQEKEIKRVLLRDLIKKIKGENIGQIQTPTLPNGARYYARQKDAEIIVIETPPQTRTIVWSEQSISGFQKEKEHKRYTLSFPYMVFVFKIVESEVLYCNPFPRLFYRNEPLTSLDDVLLHTNLQNVSFNYNWLCMHPKEIQGDLKKKIEHFLAEFWNEAFTNNMGVDDFYFTVNQALDKRINSIEAWENESRNDSLFAVKVNWLKTDLTLRNVIDGMLKDETEKREIKDASDLIDIIYQL